MYRESDHMHAIALGTVLKVGIRVVYLDRGESSPPTHDFPDECQPTIHLLYRPGHYDILYVWIAGDRNTIPLDENSESFQVAFYIKKKFALANKLSVKLF